MHSTHLALACFDGLLLSQRNRLLNPPPGKSRYEGGLELAVGSLSDSIT